MPWKCENSPIRSKNLKINLILYDTLKIILAIVIPVRFKGFLQIQKTPG